MSVRPKYGAIEAIRDILEPWIEVWGGDEWGDSMLGLHSACHTSYGLDDVDCAIVAEILLRNVIAGKETQDMYQVASDEGIASAKAESTRQREYWLKGGNLGDWSTTIEDAKSSIEQMPEWMFD